MIELADGAVRFTHPLLASVLYQGLSARERQRAHRRLAELADDPLARARHLALSTDRAGRRRWRPSSKQAAEAARRQGAPIAAGELGEHAARLTPARTSRATPIAEPQRRRARTSRRAMWSARGCWRASSSHVPRQAQSAPRRLSLMADIEAENRDARSRCCARRSSSQEPVGTAGLDPPAAQPDRSLQRGARCRRAACAERSRAGRAARRRRAPRRGLSGAGAHPLQRRQAGCPASRRGGV